MTNRLQAVFERRRKEGRRVLIPYMTAGDPDLEATERLVREVVKEGADIIELGMPYSDPLADGPTVQAAGQRALQAGTTIDGVFSLASRLKALETPVVLLVYYNCIFQRGEGRFVEEAAKAGIEALIIPDLPPEEGRNLYRLAQEVGISIIYLVAPTSTPDRVQAIASVAQGFIYCVSLTGVTGARQSLSKDLGPFLNRVRQTLAEAGKEVPLAVGFGISKPEHVQEVRPHAEGVIVGSALIDRLHQAPTLDEGITRCGMLIREMRAAADGREYDQTANPGALGRIRD